MTKDSIFDRFNKLKDAGKTPEAREIAKDMAETSVAIWEATKMSEGEAFARGLINVMVGTFGMGDRARRAKARGQGLMAKYMIDQSLKDSEDKKLALTEDEMVKAFNGEMERLKVPLVARSEGENIEVIGWNVEGDGKDD